MLTRIDPAKNRYHIINVLSRNNELIILTITIRWWKELKVHHLNKNWDFTHFVVFLYLVLKFTSKLLKSNRIWVMSSEALSNTKVQDSLSVLGDGKSGLVNQPVSASECPSHRNWAKTLENTQYSFQLNLNQYLANTVHTKVQYVEIYIGWY